MADIQMDLIREILCRCPVKSVIRFMTVSLEWFELISSQDFVSQHLRCSRSPILIHVCSPQPLNQLLLTYGHRSVEPGIHYFPNFPGAVHGLEFIGSPNGIVCVLWHPDFRPLTLWNPSTTSSLPLPPPTLIFDGETHTRVCVGMGFNRLTGDYKIVRLLERRFDYSDQVEVLSVNLGQWTVLENHARRMRMTDAPCVVANGVPYWMGFKEMPACRVMFMDRKLKKRRWLNGVEVQLVWFDVVNDSFRTEDFEWETESCRMMLGVRGDCLCAMVWEDMVTRRFDLWVKEGDRWIRRLARVEPPEYVVVPLFCGDGGIAYSCRWEGEEEESVLVLDPMGVEEDDEIPLDGGGWQWRVTDCVRVLGWTDGLTQIPPLGPGDN